MDSAITVESLGFSKDDLLERVVERAVTDLLTTKGIDENGYDYDDKSPIARTMMELIKKRIDEKIDEIAQAHILPRVGEMVEQVGLQETNQWGEAKGEKLTFTEYLVKKAGAYINADLNYEGKTKEEARGCGWSKTQTRIMYMMHQHFHYNVERAIKEALKDANAAIAGGLQKAVEIKLGEIVAKLKVNVDTCG